MDMLVKACAERVHLLSQTTDTAYEYITRFVMSRYTDSLFNMNEVAEHLGVSIYTASLVLKTFTGINFRKYLNDIRVEYAKELLLTTTYTVNEVFNLACFSYPSYLIKIFEDTVNDSPGNIRKLHVETENL